MHTTRINQARDRSPAFTVAIASTADGASSAAAGRAFGVLGAGAWLDQQPANREKAVQIAAGQVHETVHLIDWAADPEYPGAGLWLLRQIGAKVRMMIATGGSEITRRILPVIGFRPHGELYSFARPVRPLRQALAITRRGASAITSSRSTGFAYTSTKPSARSPATSTSNAPMSGPPPTSRGKPVPR